jgi:hypothetical protein
VGEFCIADFFADPYDLKIEGLRTGQAKEEKFSRYSIS